MGRTSSSSMAISWIGAATCQSAKELIPPWSRMMFSPRRVSGKELNFVLCHPFHHVSALGLALVSAIVVFQPTEVRGTTSGGAAAPFSLRRWTTEDGLPKNTITSLLQTRDGYLWVGTRDGLARFDGMRFKVFTEELRMELHGQPAKDAWPPEFSCLDLTEDAAGRLWVRLPDGLVCCHAGRFEKFPTRFGPLLANIQTVMGTRKARLA